MADKLQDKVTERHAQVLAHNYNLAPRTTKCERTIRSLSTVHTMWLARKDRTVRCLIKYYADAKSITGTPAPDVTGTYLHTGHHNNEHYYQRPDDAWFIWWDGVDTWNISEALDVQGNDYWTRTDSDIEGEYVPQGTAQGTPIVEHPNF